MKYLVLTVLLFFGVSSSALLPIDVLVDAQEELKSIRAELYKVAVATKGAAVVAAEKANRETIVIAAAVACTAPEFFQQVIVLETEAERSAVAAAQVQAGVCMPFQMSYINVLKEPVITFVAHDILFKVYKIDNGPDSPDLYSFSAEEIKNT